MRTQVCLLLFGALPLSSVACLWDADTLADEKQKSPALADVILGKAKPPEVNPTALKERLAKLTAEPREDDPAWWNDLAGAHIRLGEFEKAVQLLEPQKVRFTNDYGIHANLGTAYHLLGRYDDAEREIARDLEINPEAHFGLEKYHLALLQYLTRNTNYQHRHVYVDEFTLGFHSASGPSFYYEPHLLETNKQAQKESLAELEREYAKYSPSAHEHVFDPLLREMVSLDDPPSYRHRFNLAKDPNLEKGVIYMATLNAKQPACFVMLGILSWQNRDLNLTAAAFERAIELGSPQSDILTRKIKGIREHISKSQKEQRSDLAYEIGRGAVIVAFIGFALWLMRAAFGRSGNR